MGPYLNGTSSVSLDGKGRLSIPTRYREKLIADCDGEMVLTLDRSACLLLFPRPIFQQFERELMELKSSRQATLFRRIYLGMAADVRMDGSGRILIPTVLRERAGLKAKDERISMVGQGHKFELWAESAWNAFLDEAIDELADLEIGGADAGADLANLSML